MSADLIAVLSGGLAGDFEIEVAHRAEDAPAVVTITGTDDLAGQQVVIPAYAIADLIAHLGDVQLELTIEDLEG